KYCVAYRDASFPPKGLLKNKRDSLPGSLPADRPDGSLRKRRLGIGRQLDSQAGLLSGGVVLVQQTLGASLIDLLDSSLHALGAVLLPVLDGEGRLLDRGLEL